MPETIQHQIVIVGGGTAGITVAAQLTRSWFHHRDVAVIEPSDNAVFTSPSGAVKCGGAPQKIMYLTDDRFREAGVRDKTKIIYASALTNIFAVEPYRATLEKVIARKEIDCRFHHELIEIRPESKEAVFKNLDTQEQVTLPYDLLHVTPPMGPPTFIATSPIADKDGWVDVDKDTLRHQRFGNVFALGDCSSRWRPRLRRTHRRDQSHLVG